MSKTQRRKWNGRHSNLPECCILFFCYFWIHLPRFIRMIKVWHLNLQYGRYGEGWRPSSRQYFRCPVCLIRGRWVEQHICNDSCPKAPSER